MNNHIYFVAIAAAGLFATTMSAPAVARGGGGFGGIGGFGGHVGFATRGTTTRNTTTVTRSGSRVTTRTTTSTVTTTGRVVVPIRPEVITVPATFGTGAIVPPFGGAPIVPPFAGVPIVPPFGATTAGAQFNRLPIVTTPYGGVTGFGYATWLQPEGPAFAEPAGVLPASSAGESRTGTASAGPAAAASPLSPCHPVPNGYHCDWPS